MNSRFEINKRKEYLEGLSAAFNVSMLKELSADLEEIMADEEVSAATKETLTLWREIVAPFGNTLAYIVNNRFILDALPYIIHDDTNDNITILAEDVFDILQRLNKATAKTFVATVKGKTGCVEKIYAALLKGDKKAFVRLLSDRLCDATPLVRLCRCCWDDVSFGVTITEDELPSYLDYMAEMPVEDPDGHSMLQAAKRLQPDLKRLQECDDSEFDSHFDQYFRDCGKLNEAHFRMCVHFYQDNRSDFRSDERRLFDSILQRPEAQMLLVEREEATDEESGFDEFAPNETRPFTLPKDFFDWSHASMMPVEHLYINPKVSRRGIVTFVKFINFLAENGYIEDRPAVKALFAYRLAGRYRPEGNLPTIIWRGKNGKPYELIYLVRHLSERGDYKKMRRFFEGPEWVKDRDSSYANAADTEFRKKMSEFYPNVCPF